MSDLFSMQDIQPNDIQQNSYELIPSTEEAKIKELSTVSLLADETAYLERKYDPEKFNSQLEYDAWRRGDDPSWMQQFVANTLLTFKNFSPLQSVNIASTKMFKSEIDELDVRMTPQEYQHSEYFREGLNYYDGMTRAQAFLLSEEYDEREDLKFLSSRGGYASAAIGGSITGFLVDPILHVGVPFLNKITQINKLAKVFKASKKLSILSNAVTGGIENTAFVTAQAPFAKYNQETFGDVYGWSEFIDSTIDGALLGSVMGAASGTWNYFSNVHIEKKQQAYKGVKALGRELGDIESQVKYPDSLAASQKDAFNDMIDSLKGPEGSEEVAANIKNEFAKTFDQNIYNSNKNLKQNEYVNIDQARANKLEELKDIDYINEVKKISENESYPKDLKGKLSKDIEDAEVWESLSKDDNILNELAKCII